MDTDEYSCTHNPVSPSGSQVAPAGQLEIRVAHGDTHMPYLSEYSPKSSSASVGGPGCSRTSATAARRAES